MDVTKVVLLKDQALFGRLFLAGSKFYVTQAYRDLNRMTEKSDVFSDDMDGTLLGTIDGHYFDFGDKKVFKKSTKT